MGRKHFREVSWSVEGFFRGKRSLFGLALRFRGDSRRGATAVRLIFGKIASRINPRTYKDQSLGVQKLKTTEFSH